MSLRIDTTSLSGASGAPSAQKDPPSTKPSVNWLRRIFWSLVFLLPALVLPFVLLLRGTLEIQGRTGWGIEASLLAGAGSAGIVLALGAWAVSRILRLHRSIRWILTRGALIVTMIWVGQGLLFVATENLKDATLGAEYAELHPLLRLSTATLILLDGDAVVTDASRTVEDYAAMGIPANEASLHFVQDDGWAHAVDLRTIGRPEWRNAAVQMGFDLMGFQTLRHTGTADHLHIALPSP